MTYKNYAKIYIYQFTCDFSLTQEVLFTRLLFFAPLSMSFCMWSGVTQSLFPALGHITWPTVYYNGCYPFFQSVGSGLAQCAPQTTSSGFVQLSSDFNKQVRREAQNSVGDPCNVHRQGRDPWRGDHSCWDRYHRRLCQGHLSRLGRLSLHLPLCLQLRSRDSGLNSGNNRRIQRNSDIVCLVFPTFSKTSFDQWSRKFTKMD